MRKILSLSVFFLLCLTAGAEDFTYEYEGHTLTYTIIDEEARTCKLKAGEVPVYTKDTPGNDVSGDVVIPSEAKYYRHYFKVIEIPTAAFSGCSGITSVTIPDGITSIGYHAFSNCTGLTSVTIPNSVTDIGGDAFAGCTGLTSVTISNNVTSIGDGAFYICRGLTSVTIPNSVKSIGNLAFDGCSGLRSVTISNSLTAIGIKVFNGCSSLTSVTIPQSVTSIGNYAFDGCTDLKEVYILNSTPPSADRSSFDEQNYKNATLYVPEEAYETYDNMTDGPWKYFLKLKSLEPTLYYFNYDDNSMTATITGVNKNILFSELVIPATTTYLGKTYSVTAIGYEAFEGCSGLTSVTIPNSVRDIMDAAFSDCSSLTSITLPKSVGYIGDYAFYGSTHLTTIYSLNPTPPRIADEKCLYNSYKDATLYVPQNALDAYKNANFWKNFQNIQSIESSALYFDYDDDNMTATVTGANKEKLSSYIVIPEAITHLGKTYTVTAIGDGAFYECYNLMDVVIPNSVTDIGDYAFCYCSLLYVTIPSSVKSIGKEAFYGNKDLIKINISDILAWCNIKFSDIAANPLFCGGHLYLNRKEVTNLVIPNCVTSIGNYAFGGYSDLTSVVIPNSVTSIGYGAFIDCSGLTRVYSLNLTPPNTESYPFNNNVYQDATLYVPEEALTAYKNADSWKKFQNIKGFDPTGINGIEADGNDKRNVYYDLNGHRLSAPKKGLNIINGKKVIVK